VTADVADRPVSVTKEHAAPPELDCAFGAFGYENSAPERSLSIASAVSLRVKYRPAWRNPRRFAHSWSIRMSASFWSAPALQTCGIFGWPARNVRLR
jgi:hypothetical protein